MRVGPYRLIVDGGEVDGLSKRSISEERSSWIDRNACTRVELDHGARLYGQGNAAWDSQRSEISYACDENRVVFVVMEEPRDP